MSRVLSNDLLIHCPFCGNAVRAINQNPQGNQLIRFFYCDTEECGTVVSFRAQSVRGVLSNDHWNRRAHVQTH